MSLEAYRLRSVLGNIVLAESFLRGIRSGTIPDLPENWDFILSCLSKAQPHLNGEILSIEKGETPTMRETAQ